MTGNQRYPIVRIDNEIETRSYGITRHIGSRPMIPRETYATEIINPIETPESVIARKIPRKTAKLLEDKYERNHYTAGLAIGTNIVNNLVNKMSDLERQEISQIEISPTEEERSGLFGWRKIKKLVIKLKR